MGMSAWVIFAAPFMTPAAADNVAHAVEPSAIEIQALAADDIFGSDAIMDADAMKAASGGADTAIDIVIDTTIDNSEEYDIESLAINNSRNGSSIRDNDGRGSTAGNVSNITVSGNSGFATVINNAGNFVSIQTIWNVTVHSRTDIPNGGM